MSLRRLSPILNQDGSLLLQSMVALAIFGMIALAVMQLSLTFRQTASNTKAQDFAMQIFIDKIRKLRNADFSELASYCNEKGVLNAATPSTGRCTSGARFRSQPSSNARDKLYGLEQIFNERGQPTSGTDARTCIELVSCKARAGGHLLEVSLNQYVLIASTQQFVNRSRNFRRSRW